MEINTVFNIFEELTTDLALVAAGNTTDGCGAQEDQVTVDLFNFGM